MTCIVLGGYQIRVPQFRIHCPDHLMQTHASKLHEHTSSHDVCTDIAVSACNYLRLSTW